MHIFSRQLLRFLSDYNFVMLSSWQRRHWKYYTRWLMWANHIHKVLWWLFPPGAHSTTHTSISWKITKSRWSDIGRWVFELSSCKWQKRFFQEVCYSYWHTKPKIQVAAQSYSRCKNLRFLISNMYVCNGDGEINQGNEKKEDDSSGMYLFLMLGYR